MKRTLTLFVVCALLFSSLPALAQAPGVQPSARVGPGRYGDGESQPQRLDNSGASVMVENGGKYGEPTRRGYGFIYTTAQAGVLLAAPTTTFFGPMLWNPCGSGRDLQITKVVVADISGATVRGHLAYAYLTNAGSQQATGSAILTATMVTPVNGYLGSGLASTMRWSPGVGTYTTAPTYLAPMGPNTIGTAPGQTIMVDDVDGRIVVPQCTAFFVAGNAGITLTAAVTIYGLEIPVALTTAP